MADLRVGTAVDAHRLVVGRPLVLGGVTIPHDRGLEGHSDADVVCHVLTDAILGASGIGDIGRMFPSDAAWKDAASLELLRLAVDDFGQTVIMVTHDASAAAIADRVLFLRDGKIVKDAGRMSAPEIFDTIKTLE